MNELKNGALYIRVSTHQQEELSPESQRELLLDYARNNRILVSQEHIFIENGISGRKAYKRPKFLEMIGLAKSKEHPIDVILVWKFSRFARNQEESIVYKSMLKRDHVDVVSVSEPIIDGPFGSLIERIIEWMDEYYSIRLSGEVFRGMKTNAEKGNNQASPPLGYCVPYKRAVLEIVPEEAAIVRSIFDMYTNQRHSILYIVRTLNDAGIRTRRGSLFQRKTVQYILNNPTYAGKVVWNQKDARHKEKDASERILRDGQHEPIIPEELWQETAKRLEASRSRKYIREETVTQHLLSGLVRCSSCGGSMPASQSAPNRHGVRYYNFQCANYNRGKCTQTHAISGLKLLPIVLDGIRRILDSDDIDFEIRRPADTSSAEKKLLEEALARLPMKEQRIRDAYLNGIDSLEEYRENKALLSKERSRLESSIEELSHVPDNLIELKPVMLQRVREIYDYIQDESVPVSERNASLKTILEKIVYDKKENQVQLFFYYA